MRSRNIKPSFFINEDLGELTPQERLLFIGLWCYSDRDGFFANRPRKIAAEIFPYDREITADNIKTMMCNLMLLHFITFNDAIGCILNFLKHQRPHPHEAKSLFTDEEKKALLNQCHGMSLHVTKCPSDIRILGMRNEERGDIVVQEKPARRPRPKIPFFEIVSRLNEKTGTGFKDTSKTTRQLISARYAEGFSISDFFEVIDHKTAEWKPEPEMAQYLRPQTLFGTKFESYLQAARAGEKMVVAQNIVIPDLEEVRRIKKLIKETPCSQTHQ